MVAPPVPLALPLLTVSHAESLVAVHVHGEPVVNATLPVPPVSANDCPVEASEYAQACVICSVAPVVVDVSVWMVTCGTASVNVMLCPGSRMKSAAAAVGWTSSSKI